MCGGKEGFLFWGLFKVLIFFGYGPMNVPH
jgi:hypothetical protein